MRRVRRWLGFAVLAAIAGLWAVTLRPAILGGPATYIVIRGDSMNPTYATGDLVILSTADRYAVGDVVAYRVPAGELGAGLVVVHRIIGGEGQSGFVLKGDGNPAPDQWRPLAGDVVGTSAIWLPGAGRVVAALRQPAVLAAFCAALAVSLFILPAPPRRTRPSPRGAALVERHRDWETWTKPAH